MGLDDLFPLASPDNRAAFAEFIAFAYERFQAFEENEGWGTVVTKSVFRAGRAEAVIDASERHSKNHPRPAA